MKTFKYLLLFTVVISLQSCIYWGNDDEIDDVSVYESQYKPITQPRATFENSINMQESRPISDAGKIYIKDQYILINENEEGFHLYNNINPEQPEPMAYIKVQGATDLAIRGNTIFVHHLVDLVALEYNFNTHTIESINRSPNVFPRLSSPDGFSADFFDVSENEIIIGYELKN